MWLGLLHSSIAGIFQCLCTHPINLMCIHLLYYVQGNEHMGTHDVVCNTFATIARDVGFHVGWKQLHVLPSTTFNSSCQQVDIVLTKDGIRTLVNIVIANPTWAYLLPWSCAPQGFTTFDAAQAKKKKNYHDWHPIAQFLFLTIEVSGCLHKHVNVFLHNGVNTIWNLERLEGLHLSILIIFLHQKISITLQRI